MISGPNNSLQALTPEYNDEQTPSPATIEKLRSGQVVVNLIKYSLIKNSAGLVYDTEWVQTTSNKVSRLREELETELKNLKGGAVKELTRYVER